VLHRRLTVDARQGVGFKHDRATLTLPQQGFFRVTVGIAELDGNQVQQSRRLAIAEGLYRGDHTTTVTDGGKHPNARQVTGRCV